MGYGEHFKKHKIYYKKFYILTRNYDSSMHKTKNISDVGSGVILKSQSHAKMFKLILIVVYFYRTIKII